jgi:hypothetical protein
MSILAEHNTSMLLRGPAEARWTDRVAFDFALALEAGTGIKDVMVEYDMSREDVLELNQDVVFLKRIDEYRGEIREKGMSFRLKARAQAEDLLTTSYLLIHDPAVSPAVKADLIKATVKWADLEPKHNTVDGGNGAGSVTITINLSDKTKTVGHTYDSERAAITDETL